VLRFIHNLKTAKGCHKVGDLGFEELETAKFVVFRCIQGNAYPTELQALELGKPVHKSSSIAKLDPFIGEDGLLRVKGRLQFSDLSYGSKHPIILPKCHVSKLLVRFQHVLLKHAGVETLITSLRNNYWILGVRRVAKQVKRECVPCQRFDSKACNQPVAPLPDLRVKESPPFCVIGLDNAGPLFCSDDPSRKLYILLFTCAVVRAVHLEITESLSLVDFMLAFRRFVSRRGLPKIVYSDNAKTFVGAQAKLLKHFGPLSPQWKFIMPRSPWWGGWWERLVRSVKGALRKSLGAQVLTKVELETTVQEIEACINSRPLTFVADEVSNGAPLTPSHFLIGRGAGFQLDATPAEEVVFANSLGDREVVRQEHLNRFWALWSQDYLRNLPPTVNHLRARGNLKIGSVVLIREDNVGRLHWPMGKVNKLFPGRDGVVRSVELQTARGPVLRSIQRLHQLEVPEALAECNEDKSDEDKSQSVNKDKKSSDWYITKSGRASKPVEKYV
jgi:hypothetical protein